MNAARSPDAADEEDGVDLVDDDDDPDRDLTALLSAARAPAAQATTSRFTVPFASRGQRVDAVVARELPALSRSRATALVQGGCVVVDGKAPKASAKLVGGEVVVVTVPPPAPVDLVAEDLPLTLVYDDDDLCVVDKPAGLVVHPGAGHDTGTLANALLFRFPSLSVGGERRPGIVHRLDKDTSGLIVVAKHDVALRALAAQFAARTVTKRYVALCLGLPGEAGRAFDVVTGHARHAGDRRRFTTRLPAPNDDDRAGVPSSVRRAASRFCVRAAGDGVAVVDVTLLTGRTHQIRAHLADRGHPLLQDALYGGAHAERRLKNGAVRDAVVLLQRQALHAAALAFAQPRTGVALSFTSALPEDLARVVAAVDPGAAGEARGARAGDDHDTMRTHSRR